MRAKEEIIKEMTKIERKEKALERREKLLEKRREELLTELGKIDTYMIKQLSNYVGKCYEVACNYLGHKEYFKVTSVNVESIALYAVSLMYVENEDEYLFTLLKSFYPNKYSEIKEITLEEFNIHYDIVKKMSNNRPGICSW